METKLLKPIRSRRHMRARCKYAGDADAKTHRDLSSIEVDYHGPAKSPTEMVVLSRQFEEETLGKRQRPTKVFAYEIIFSTPHGVFLDRAEEDIFLASVIRTLKAVAYAIGRHRHKNGRTDFHIVALNRCESGGCLALGLVSPKTGRANRNLKRVMRAAADVGHDALNRFRLGIGKPWISTMSEVIDKKIRERQERKAREAQLLAEMDSANDVGPTEDGFFPGDEPAETDSVTCEEITTKIYQVGAGLLAPAALADWFDFSDGGRPRARTVAVAKASNAESAAELMNAFRLLAEILAEREAEQDREAEQEREEDRAL